MGAGTEKRSWGAEAQVLNARTSSGARSVGAAAGDSPRLPPALRLAGLDPGRIPVTGTAPPAASQGARTPGASFLLPRRSSRPRPNMLDGLKMEENFPSAIETSASFSSLLGECSGRSPAVRPAQLRSPARRDRWTAGPRWRPAHRAESTPVCQAVPRVPAARTGQRPPPPAPGTEVPRAARAGRACSLASEWQVIKNTRGWIFNHEADRRLTNAAPSPRPGASDGGRGPRRAGLSRLRAPTGGGGAAEGLFRAGGQRGD